MTRSRPLTHPPGCLTAVYPAASQPAVFPYPNTMPSIAITGGIACGKSYVIGKLATMLDVTPFDADAEVTQLFEHDREVVLELRSTFGNNLFDHQGKIVRAALRSLITHSSEHKKNLEAILHPRLRKKWMPLAAASFSQENSTFLAEIPLLYENNLAAFFNYIIVVASSEQTQLHRLTQERKLSRNSALSMLHLQQPLHEKIALADVVIWNDGGRKIVEQQMTLLINKVR
ncbi:MAG: dephospho-CoA kinase [Chthoniobacterales bacterium]